jgi:hypothetical protein
VPLQVGVALLQLGQSLGVIHRPQNAGCPRLGNPSWNASS